MSFDSEIADALSDITDEAGRLVRLHRGAITCVITATPAATRTQTETHEGARVQTRERDYIIHRDQYRFAQLSCSATDRQSATDPQPGDEIIDQGRRYELTRLGDAVGCWEWSDRGETYYRVHTREIGRE